MLKAAKSIFATAALGISLLASTNASAFTTIVTGSYSIDRLANAMHRINQKSFASLDASLLKTRDRSAAVRVVVGCFNSDNEARAGISDVRKAGAKGVWLMHVKSCVKHKTLESAGLVYAPPMDSVNLNETNFTYTSADTYRGQETFTHKESLKLKLSTSLSSYQSVIPSKSSNDVGLKIGKVMDADVARSEWRAIDGVSESARADDHEFRPTKWMKNDGKTIAFTSGISPKLVESGDGLFCKSIIRNIADSEESITAPSVKDSYVTKSSGSKSPDCQIMYVYQISVFANKREN